MRWTRRRTLRAAGAGFAAALAGCSDAEEAEEGGEPPEVGSAPTDEDGPGYGVSVAEVVQLGPREDEPAWQTGEATGFVQLEDSAAILNAPPLADRTGEAREQAEAVVARADFRTERVCYVAAVGPDSCYDRVDLDVQEDDATGFLGGSADAVSSGTGEACAEVVTVPGALFRFRFEEVPVDQVRLDITDGWGQTATYTGSVDDAYPIDPASLSGRVRPGGEPATVPPARTCEEFNATRHPFIWPESSVQWGEVSADNGLPAWALRVDQTDVSRGDTVTITLTNVSRRPAATGSRFEYSLQVQTEAGWQDLRVRPADAAPIEYSGNAVSHAPGEGFEWELELTESGLLDGHVHADQLSVCPDLPAGRYRFVYWYDQVAVAFDVA